MNHKELPMAEPVIKGFSHQAILLSILMAQEKCKPWICNNYLRVFTLRDLKDQPPARLGRLDFFYSEFINFNRVEFKANPWHVDHTIAISDYDLEQRFLCIDNLKDGRPSRQSVKMSAFTATAKSIIQSLRLSQVTLRGYVPCFTTSGISNYMSMFWTNHWQNEPETRQKGLLRRGWHVNRLVSDRLLSPCQIPHNFVEAIIYHGKICQIRCFKNAINSLYMYISNKKIKIYIFY